MVKQPHFVCNNLVHHPIDFQPLKNWLALDFQDHGETIPFFNGNNPIFYVMNWELVHHPIEIQPSKNMGLFGVPGSWKQQGIVGPPLFVKIIWII